jgi:hypothetical protein
MIEAKRMVSPLGEAVYPHLIKPDVKFNPLGEYKITLKLNKSEASKFIAEIDKYIEECLATFEKDGKGKKVKQAPKPYTVEGNNFFLKLKLKASGTNKKTQETYTQRPALFDAKKNPFPVEKSIWGGSKVKVAFDLVPYSVASIGAGVTARIKAVQIIELVQGGSKEDNLFKVEDGYTTEINTNDETSAVQTNSDF